MAGWRGFGYWRPYVPVWKRRARAAKMAAKLAKKGNTVEPVEVDGRAIARTFWGKAWCENLEHYSDFENRLPRGRTYVRNGSVIDLQIKPGRVEALVSGSSIYKVRIDFAPLKKGHWAALRKACAGRIGSVVELLQGRLADSVMELMTDNEAGLFPSPPEIEMSCSCPDYATLCKHVAASLYGVGARLDLKPELLFSLRHVDHLELIGELDGAPVLAGAVGESAPLGSDEIAQVFGIELDTEAKAPPARSARRRIPDAPAAPRRRGARARLETQGGQAAKARPAVFAKEENGLPGHRRRGRPARGAPRSRPGLDARLPILREHFGQDGSITNALYRWLFSLDAATASRELRQLVETGVLVLRGAKRGAYYEPGARLKQKSRKRKLVKGGVG